MASAAATATRQHFEPLRRFYWVAVVLVSGVGVFLFVLSNHTARLFAWTIKPPLTAAFLGANYWAALPLAVSSARERVWAFARLTFAVSIVFITGTMVATLLHLDKFHFGNLNGWFWTIVYVGIPPLLLVAIAFQLRLPGGDPPRERPIERWLLPLVAVQLVAAAVVGISLFIAPSTADGLWPWTLTPLTSQAVGAWLLALAAGLGSVLWERDWQRVRAGVPTFFLMPVLQAVALARYSGTVDWTSRALWLYLTYLASLLVLGGFGLYRTQTFTAVARRAGSGRRGRSTPPESSPPARASAP